MSLRLAAVPAVLGAAAVLLLVPGHVRVGADGSSQVRVAVRALRFPMVAPALVTAALLVGVRGVHLGLVLVAGLAAVCVLKLVAGARQARDAALRRQRVVNYCEALAGELRAGQPVAHAVERSVEVWPETHLVVAAVRIGADVPAALRRLAALPGAGGVARLAAAWELCSATGSGLAFAVEQVLETARVEQATARLVQGELASARATARLVIALPVVVLLAAEGIGARPWHFLLSTVAGVSCLGVGVALALTGLWWIDRIGAAAAEGGR